MIIITFQLCPHLSAYPIHRQLLGTTLATALLEPLPEMFFRNVFQKCPLEGIFQNWLNSQENTTNKSIQFVFQDNTRHDKQLYTWGSGFERSAPFFYHCIRTINFYSRTPQIRATEMAKSLNADNCKTFFLNQYFLCLLLLLNYFPQS